MDSHHPESTEKSRSETGWNNQLGLSIRLGVWLIISPAVENGEWPTNSRFHSLRVIDLPLEKCDILTFFPVRDLAVFGK